MVSKKAQSKAGVAANRRGQQMGDERSNNSSNKQEESKASTPALRGRRQDVNKFFADDSQQAVGGNAARPRSNSPSVAGAVPTGVKKGEPGGEKISRRRGTKR